MLEMTLGEIREEMCEAFRDSVVLQARFLQGMSKAGLHGAEIW